MAGSSFGALFAVHTWGESHGGAVGCVVDGCPAGLTLDLDAVQHELDRRRPGQSKLVSQRKETDEVQVLSGLSREGVTLGTPLLMLVPNKDARPGAYADLADLYRPSHADFTYEAKYGLRALSGGGRASARETVGRVAAGAVARQVLREVFAVEVVAWVDRVEAVAVPEGAVDEAQLSATDVDAHPTRCPHPPTASAMEEAIVAARSDGDSVGGVVRCVARGVPAGWGEPVFDKLEADLGRAMLSLPAVKAFEVGSGFPGTRLRGSTHNDAFVPGPAGPRTRTNHSGGIQGGISNGMPIRLRVGFKPTATIFMAQDTVNRAGEASTISPKGRHDPCVVPRAVPIVEAMAALVLLDHALRHRAATL
ncbi:MAG: chorismate synthase [Deltaproteobacteria bacterium]|nr:chorismate synthase [Deltaproteobacteria bacterium]